MPQLSMADAHMGVGVKARLFQPEEWERLRDYGPFKAAGKVLPDPQHAFVLVLEEASGEIVGCWMARDMVLLEGLFLSPEHRHSHGAAKTLFLAMIAALDQRGVSQAMTLIQDPYVEGLAKTAGFEKLDGALHVLSLGKVG